MYFANFFFNKAAHVFLQSDISGTWLWNLLGRYDHVLQSNKDLECNEKNECHILFVSIELNINIILGFHILFSVFQILSLFFQQVLHMLLQPVHRDQLPSVLYPSHNLI